jgi:type VI secretion system protein ImpL
MGQLADKLNMVAVLPGGGGETGSAASLDVKALVAQLDQSGANMPAPAGLLVKAVASDANVALGGARKSQMGAALSGNFGEDCRNVLGRSFPLLAASANDISLEQFGHFFAPQGAFAKFVTQELAGYVDTTKPEWVLLPNASEIGMTETGLQSFQAAQKVTRAFFAADPNAPRLVYQIEPVALSGAKSVTLKADGQSLTYDGKSGVPATFDWPGAGGASVEFAIDGAAPAVKSWVGVWGAFRMMKEAAVKAAGSPLAGAGSLTQGGARFDFRVRTFGGSNPFVVDPFVKVSCPV